MSKIYKVIDLALRLGLDNATVSAIKDIDENYFNEIGVWVSEPKEFKGEWIALIDLEPRDLVIFETLEPDVTLAETSCGRILLFKF